MPTGYTAAIADGITFEQYALSCARAFGALVMMRDEPHDAPIPDRFEPSDHAQKVLERTHAELNRLLNLSAQQIAEEAQADFDGQLNSWNDRMQRAADLGVKYEAMLEKVKAWKSPTPDHDEYKAFMESQIVESIRFDCNTSYDTRPEQKAPAVWIADRLAALHHDLSYYENAHREEVERAAGRTAWVQALKASLV